VVHGTDGLDRWPALAARAGSVGIRSVLSEPLRCGPDVLASLNLYSRAAGFGDEAMELSAVFAGPAATAFANATTYAAAIKLNENLREAIATREIIGEAKGILMARQGCTSDESFDILRRASQRTNRKLRDIAVELVETTEHSLARGGSVGGQPA
jgi:GAF domain-containing protein